MFVQVCDAVRYNLIVERYQVSPAIGWVHICRHGVNSVLTNNINNVDTLLFGLFNLSVLRCSVYSPK